VNFTSNQLKKSAALTIPFAGVFEYAGAMISNSLPALKGKGELGPVDALSYYFSHPIENIQNALSTPAFIEMQPFLLGAALFFAGKGLFDQTTYKDASDYGAYGTTRWATIKEIFNKENNTSDTKIAGQILGKVGRKLIIQKNDSELNRNILLVGGAGAGKTTGKIIPNILFNTSKSMVISDPKGELYELTSEIKRKQGYKVHLFNFKDRNISDRFNIFDYFKKDSDAYKAAHAYVTNTSSEGKPKDDFWNQAQASLLQAFMLYVKYKFPKEQHHMGSVFALAQVDYQEMMKRFLEFPDGHIVKRAYKTAMEKLQDKTQDNAFISLMMTLLPWMYEDVCKFTYKSDMIFGDIAKEKTIVYVILPIADNEFKPLIATFFTQLFTELYAVADENFNKLPVSVIMELDEFANIGRIPNFDERHSSARGLGIDITIGLQDMSQLEKVYGKQAAKEIIGNCDIRMLMKANEFESAQYFSKMAGKTTVEIKSRSSSNGSRSKSSSESTQVVSRELITPDEILRMKKNEMLLFMSGYYPMKVKKAFSFKTKLFKDMLKQSEPVSRKEYPIQDRTEYKVFNPDELEAAKDLINNQLNEENILPDPDHKTTLSEVMSAATKETNENSTTNEEEEKESVDELLATFKF
jgi:type IV secretion system protein VirD4